MNKKLSKIMDIKRRHIIGGSLATAATLGFALSHGRQQQGRALQAEASVPLKKTKVLWRMITAWPKNFPGLGTGANQLARYINDLSDGEMQVITHGGGEIVPPLETFNAVAEGTAQMGHGSPQFWRGKIQAAQFFSATPFGMTAQEMNAWIYQGGGQRLWDDLYAKFNIKPFLAGNTGGQMGGWFNRDINSPEDMKGLKMRIPGLGGETLSKIGVTPKLLPADEIFIALETGVVDAVEWAGPYNDLAFGLHKIARYYYYPGWHEPGSAIELLINKTAYDTLPAHLQNVIMLAAQAANMDMLCEFHARNSESLETLINQHQVQLRRFPDALLNRLKIVSHEVISDIISSDKDSQKIVNAITKFRKTTSRWTMLSDQDYLRARRMV